VGVTAALPGRTLRERWLEDRRSQPPAPAWHLRVLVGIVVLAALLRFPTLDARGYWIDEAVIVHLAGLTPSELLHRLASGTEGTPPLYYLLALAWTHVFGDGEVGLRSLSAVVGLASVPVAYLAGRELISSRVGLLAALMFAVSPILVWHSQDARAHSLALLLSSLSFLYFLRSLREPRGRNLALWAAASGVGLLTHYFVFFLVAVEALWLLAAFPRRRELWLAIGVVAIAGFAALLVALQQRSNVNLTYDQYGSLASRLVQAPAQVLVGEQPPLQRAMAVLAALLVLPALAMLRRADPREQRAAALCAGILVPALGAMVLAALAGADYVSARNTLPVFLPVVLLLACGFASTRASRAVRIPLAALLALWLFINIATAWTPKFDREDWRGAAAALGPAPDARAIVITPYAGRGPLEIYLPGSHRMLGTTASVREVDVVALAPLFRKVGETPRPPSAAGAPPAPPGFTLVERRSRRYYTILRYRSKRAAVLDRRALAATHLGAGRPEVLLQPEAR
jgi:mannosyltransferase